MKLSRPNNSTLSAKGNGRKTGALLLAAFAGALTVSACTGTRDYRGFVVQEDVLAQVRLGITKSEVERLLGSPSATSTIEGKNFYYISSVFETQAFYAPEEVDRRVIAIYFDEQDQVRNIADYRLQDGKVFDFISRTTPTRGKELSFIQQLFGNIGKFGGSGTGLSSVAKPAGS